MSKYEYNRFLDTNFSCSVALMFVSDLRTEETIYDSSLILVDEVGVPVKSFTT